MATEQRRHQGLLVRLEFSFQSLDGDVHLDQAASVLALALLQPVVLGQKLVLLSLDRAEVQSLELGLLTGLLLLIGLFVLHVVAQPDAMFLFK